MFFRASLIPFALLTASVAAQSGKSEEELRAEEIRLNQELRKLNQELETARSAGIRAVTVNGVELSPQAVRRELISLVGAKIVKAKNGDITMGLVVESEASVQVFQTDPSSPPATIKRADIASIEDAKISQMPPGLLNTLNPEELKDLIAYLLSGGNKRDRVFRKR